MNDKFRKRIWPVPLVAIIGAIAVLTTVWMAPAAQAQQPPPVWFVGAGLMAAPASDTQINLTWKAANGAVSYQVQRHSGDGNFAMVSPGPSGSVTSYSDMGLMASTTYTYRVRGVNAAGNGNWSDTAMATTDAGDGIQTPPTAKCEVGVNAAGTVVTVPSGGCSAQGDTAEVVFKGRAAATKDATLSLLIADAAGPITAYPNGTTWSGGKLVDANGADAESMRYRFQSITVPKAKANPTTGIIEGQKVTLMVKGDVYVWAGSVSVTDPINGIPSGNAASGSREIADNTKMLGITFLGTPAIGKDGDDDNKTLDLEEVRSRLDVDSDATAYVAADVSVEDGKVEDITLTGTQSAVTIRATIVDAKNSLLNDIEVTFTATSDPAGVENRTRSYDSGKGVFPDGVADHTISGLPTDKPYRVTVVVTAGETNPLTVGTIVIARAGDLDNVMAEACYAVAADKDVADDGCMKGYNPKMIYGPGMGFAIEAMAADSRGTMVEPDTFMVKPAKMDGYGDATEAFNIPAAGSNVPDSGMVALTVEDDAPGAKYLLDVVATTGTGSKMITKTDQVTIIVSDKVAKYEVSPEEAFVQRRRSQEFTVTAVDKNGNPPIFATVNDVLQNKVKVIADYGIVRGANYNRSTEELTLDENTGMGTFTFVMPRDAEDGEPFSILIGDGDMQVEVLVTVGDETMAPGMPMNVNAMAEGQDMIKVTWDAPAADGNSAITGYMVQSAYMMADGMMSDWMDVDPAHMGMERMYTDMDLMPGTKYYYRVAAMNAVGMGEYSDGMAMAMTEMMPVLGVPGVTGAMSNAAGMATISIMPAANADKHYVWAFPTDYSDGMYSGEAAGDATSVTMSGLTSGKSYWFTVVAGMDMDDGSTEWKWATAWTGATAIQ